MAGSVRESRAILTLPCKGGGRRFDRRIQRAAHKSRDSLSPKRDRKRRAREGMKKMRIKGASETLFKALNRKESTRVCLCHGPLERSGKTEIVIPLWGVCRYWKKKTHTRLLQRRVDTTRTKFFVEVGWVVPLLGSVGKRKCRVGARNPLERERKR